MSTWQEKLRRDMAAAAEFQARMVDRTSREVEEDYAVSSRCACHCWEWWRCHVVQATRAARYVQRKRKGVRR